MRHRVGRWSLWLVVLLGQAGGNPSPSPADTLRYVRSLETYRVPPVTLVDQAGERVALASVLDGDEPVLVNFLFTSCPATCPVATAIVANMRQALGPEGGTLRILSISIDPAHDTPTILQGYARRHQIGPGWRLLTGEAGQIQIVLKAFGVSAGKATHTPLTLLRTPGSRHWVRLSGFPTSAELIGEYRRLRGI